MNNHSKHIIERTYPGVWPNRLITAPCYRDDGAKSHRDYTPLKSPQLPKQETRNAK